MHEKCGIYGFPFLWENACENAKKVVDIPRQTVYYINVRCEHAEVAELADAQASGACGSNIVWVQVPSPALTGKSVNGFLFYFMQIFFIAFWLLMVCNRCLLH